MSALLGAAVLFGLPYVGLLLRTPALRLYVWLHTLS